MSLISETEIGLMRSAVIHCVGFFFNGYHVVRDDPSIILVKFYDGLCEGTCSQCWIVQVTLSSISTFNCRYKL